MTKFGHLVQHNFISGVLVVLQVVPFVSGFLYVTAAYS